MKATLLRSGLSQQLHEDEPVLMKAVLAFSAPATALEPGDALTIGEPAELALEGSSFAFPVHIAEAGRYALFTEHHPYQFGAALTGSKGVLSPVVERAFKPDHEHDEEVSSVGIDLVGDLDQRRLNRWLSTLLQTQGTDIFRMKGVLSIAGEVNRFVFQGVHMLFDGRPDRPWGGGQRQNQMIFIGRNLDRTALTEGFRHCLVSGKGPLAPASLGGHAG